MKAFWAIILVLLLAGGAYAVLGLGNGSRGVSRPSQPTVIATPAPVEEVRAPAPVPVAEAAPVPEPAPVEAAAPEVSDASVDAPAESAPAVPEVALDENGVPLAPIEGFTIAPSSIETKADGTLLFDGKYAVTGAGTAEDPYVLPWELLMSAERTFDPPNGRKQIPQRLVFFNNKNVIIKGYVLFPLMIQVPRELLLMQNQWDGCCIGVPPSPYDSIEVRLKKTPSEEMRYAATGQIKGRFSVKPFLTGDWIVGLYLIDAGELSAEDFAGPGAS